MMNRHAVFSVAIALLGLFACGPIFACKVPVFRYALERWPADNYRMVALLDGPPDQEALNAIEALKAIDQRDVNFATEVIDLSKLSEAEVWSIEGIDATDQVPLLQVFYPERDGQQKICWTGSLTTENVQAWVRSPIRDQITENLLDGASAVWVLVEGNDPSENADFKVQLQSALESASKQISIPDGVIRREDAANHLSGHPGATMDDVLRSDIPLRIDFRLTVLAFDDSQETSLRAMIEGATPSVDAPFVFPVFGRGRMIEPLSFSEFRQSAVLSACRYMVGECSCSVKALNPGVDLVLAADWQASLGDSMLVLDTPAQTDLPPPVIPPGHQPPEMPERETTDVTGPKRGQWMLAFVIVACLPLVVQLVRRAK